MSFSIVSQPEDYPRLIISKDEKSAKNKTLPCKVHFKNQFLNKSSLILRGHLLVVSY